MEINKIVSIINEKGIKAEIREVQKGSVTKTGIELGDGLIRPVLYLESFNQDLTDEEAADEIIGIYERNKTPEFDTDQIMDIDYIKENMTVAIRRPAEDQIFTKDILDMQVYIRVMIKESNGTASYAIRKEMAEKLGLTDEIFDEAIKNMTFVFKSLVEAFVDMHDVEIQGEGDIPDDCGMYVISTPDRVNGAAAFYDLDVIKSAAEKLDSDLIVVPSSIHELLVIKYDGKASLEEMSAMVVEVNNTQVSPEEQLSDHAYLYIRETNEFKF